MNRSRSLMLGFFLATFAVQAPADNSNNNNDAEIQNDTVSESGLVEISGNWQGEITISGSEIIPISLSLPTKEAGSWYSPAHGCKGTMQLSGTEPNGYLYQIHVLDGPCEDGGTMLLTPQEQGLLNIKFSAPDGQTITGWMRNSLHDSQMVGLENAELNAGQTNVTYSGYSERFVGIRNLYATGDLQQIQDIYAGQEAATLKKSNDTDKFDKRIGLLGWLERGNLALDQGNYESALIDFTKSEDLVEKQQGQSTFVRGLKKISTQTLKTISGEEEFGPYNPSGWEKVLMLNYKTITYLLQGDRRAYNVTRRAIDWQNIEKKIFDAEVAEDEEKLAKKYAKKKAKQDKKNAKRLAKGEKIETQEPQEKDAKAQPSPNEVEEPMTAVRDVYARMLEPMNLKASSVASAYVNPFGFYVAGMIQEFESYSDSSLQDNARISYSKALELNPESKVLLEAVSDMEKQSVAHDMNLVHVIVAEGFVPEKKVLTYNLLMQQYGVIPLKLQIYEPVPSEVDHIEVHSKSGEYLATLSTVADVEALCLRQQKDMQRILVLKAVSTTMVSAVIEGSAQKQTGIAATLIKLGGKLRQQNAAPDTRSWMSLPATVQATRLHLEKGVDQIVVVSFDQAGNILLSQPVHINPDSPGVVYIRSVSKVMYVKVVNQLWM